VGSERNHKNRKTDNQKALKEPGLYKQIWLPGQDDVRTFWENVVDKMEIPIFDIPV